MLNDLFALIKKHEVKGDFTHAEITDEVLIETEKRMQIVLPIEYKYFLKEFGHGGIGGLEVLGIGKNALLIFEKETLKYQTYGLPKNLVIIENCDEWVYCINSNDGTVVMWSRGDSKYTVAYDSFTTYLYDRVNDMLENM